MSNAADEAIKQLQDSLKTTTVIHAYYTFLDKDGNICDKNDENRFSLSVYVTNAIKNADNTYTPDLINRPEYCNVDDSFYIEDESDFSDMISSLINQYFGKTKEFEKQKGNAYGAFILTRGVYKGNSVDELHKTLMSLVVTKFNNICIKALEGKLSVPLENINIENLNKLEFSNIFFPLVGFAQFKCKGLILNSCEFYSRYESSDNQTLGQINFYVKEKCTINRLLISSDMRFSLYGVKENKDTWPNNELYLYDLKYTGQENVNRTMRGDCIFKIQDFFKATISNIELKENLLNKANFMRFKQISQVTIKNAYISRGSQRLGGEFFIDNCSITTIEDCSFTGTENSGQALSFTNIGEMNEIYINNNNFVNYNLARFLSNECSKLQVFNNSVKGGNFLNFKGKNSIYEVNIKENTCNIESFVIDEDYFKSNDLNINNNKFELKGDFKIAAPYLYMNDNTITANNVSITTSQNLFDPKRQSLYIENTYFNSKDEVIFASSVDDSKLSLYLVNIECQTYRDHSYSKAHLNESQIKSKINEFDSFLYDFEDHTLELSRANIQNAVIIRGCCKGDLHLDYRNVTSNFVDIMFDPEIRKNDDKWYLNVNFKGNSGQNQLINFKIHDSIQNIVCTNNDYTFTTRINLYVEDAILMDKACYVFAKENNNIIMKLEKVIDSRLGDCVYSTDGKITRKKFNYGITK